MTAQEVFEKEWEIWRAGRAEFPSRREINDRKGTAGDAPVKVGEIRVIGGMEPLTAALVVEACGAAGWRIVPVSPLTVPASERERLVGGRVLQLWNACVAARPTVERSWLVETVDAADVAEVVARLAAAQPGRLTKGDGAQAQYERTFLVAGGNFRSLVRQEPKPQVLVWRRYGGWSLAAMLLIGLGVGWLFVREEALPPLYEVQIASMDDTCELSDCDELEEMPDEIDPLDVVAANVQPQPEPVPLACAVAERQAPQSRGEVSVRGGALETVAFVSSPIKKKCMVGSRTPRAVCADPSRPYSGTRYPSTERYAEFRENEFQDPADAPLSTFALDVDTTSYTLMRHSLGDMKWLPPKEAVRLEEFVNYFTYDYLAPQGRVPVAVDCELADCPWNAAHKLLRLGVQARKVADADIPPCNLTFLIDRSGSMAGNNGMDLLKSGLKLLVGKLRAADTVSIVTYADGTQVELAATSGAEKEKIAAVIDRLQPGGCTYGSAGIQLAYAEAQKNFDPKANNRVILVTDGDFNVGISSPEELEAFIAEKRASGIFLSVIGVGHGNYQDASMKKLANAGNGNYAYLDSVLEAKKVMRNEFGGTLLTVAKDVKVQVEFNPAEVASYRLLGYENRLLQSKDFNDDRKDAGEMGAGHSMTAFYEIVPNGTAGEAASGVDPLKYQMRATVASEEMFTLKLRWKAPDGDTSELSEIAYRAADVTKATPSEDFRFASAVAEFALWLEDSKFKGAASCAAVLERARAAKGADAEGYRAEFIRLVETAALLEETEGPVNRARRRNVK